MSEETFMTDARRASAGRHLTPSAAKAAYAWVGMGMEQAKTACRHSTLCEGAPSGTEALS
jgi:hypothetical protein